MHTRIQRERQRGGEREREGEKESEKVGWHVNIYCGSCFVVDGGGRMGSDGMGWDR